MSEVINIKELNERIERESVFVDTLNMEMSKVIVGQKHLVDTLLIGVGGGRRGGRFRFQRLFCTGRSDTRFSR